MFGRPLSVSPIHEKNGVEKMRIYEEDYTRCVDDDEHEYVELDLEDPDIMEQMIYALAERYDRSPTSKCQIEANFKLFGLALTKVPL